MQSAFEIARKKYRPDPIKCLFLAEAPPDVDSKRFFYFEEVNKGDTLYLETMKALFPGDSQISEGIFDTQKLRSQKKSFLTKYRNNGFYLDDASKIPMPKQPSPSDKRRIIRTELPGLIDRLLPFIKPRTPIILISSTVHEICFHPLKQHGLNILNGFSIPFPIGFQKEYKSGIIECLLKAGLYPST